ncbi:Phosphoglycolate phosphatase [Pontiella desulfatans]|uniref:phosphoglycolate phosphatase n=1 Tax=Pontiella desulfatans TaxID=2750659 RepID=A0A6C2U2D5_PONDE|nr:HAD-IA family hydrolase [Pontiella desulfatans]VGO14130.1 Phosphoglycolate phosphatase [Pontiella desulfatans]
MEPQLLIFDLDGTLIDSRADLAAGINHMRCHYGLAPLPLETVSGYVGNGVRKLVERSLQGAEVDVDEALAINKAYYAGHLVVHTYLYDGVADGIAELVKAGHKVALLTNKPGEPSRRILEHFGLADRFTSIIGGGDVPNLKPEPDGILACMEAAGMDAATVWMVGDNYTDLAVAENAGVKNAYVRYGFGEERGYKADAYFASFSELVGYFV